MSAIKNIAIVGATGRLGGFFAQELLKAGDRHTLTAITRAGSKAEPPKGMKVAAVDYDDEDSLVAALKGQEFLIITLSVMAPPDTSTKLIKAAGKAGVPYVMPNVHGADYINDFQEESNPYYEGARRTLKAVNEAGSSFILDCPGFWYEWSLARGLDGYGIDIGKKKAVFLDGGSMKINTSTWEQCGLAIAALLKLPESGSSPSVSDYKNKPFYYTSFLVNQRDMLDSVHRVMGTTDADWDITDRPSAQQHSEGVEEMKKGDMSGFAKALYSRIYLEPEAAHFSTRRELANSKLGLPEEDLDTATKRAVDMVAGGWNPFGQ